VVFLASLVTEDTPQLHPVIHGDIRDQSIQFPYRVIQTQHYLSYFLTKIFICGGPFHWHAGMFISLTKKQKGQCNYNGTLRRIRATILAVEKQQLLHVLSVCL
jgi:uncharacterized membrane protein YciS (DUF1049 family)